MLTVLWWRMIVFPHYSWCLMDPGCVLCFLSHWWWNSNSWDGVREGLKLSFSVLPFSWICWGFMEDQRLITEPRSWSIVTVWTHTDETASWVHCNLNGTKLTWVWFEEHSWTVTLLLSLSTLNAPQPKINIFLFSTNSDVCEDSQ